MSILKKTIQARKFFKVVILSGVMLCSIQATQAQVTIGSDLVPNQDALLDLQQNGPSTKGLLLPRVALVQTTSFNPMSAHVEGMVVYNTATAGDVTPGYYYNNGVKWKKLYSAEDSFFYLPSSLLPIDESDPACSAGLFTIDLYNDVYKAQFGLTATTAVASDASARLSVYQSNELHYFVTYYDDQVFDEVKISNAGILTYKLKANFTYTEKTFMNIICKVK